MPANNMPTNNMPTNKEKEISRQYTRDFLISMVAYSIVLIASLWAMRRIESGWMVWVLAVLPVIPILFALRVFLRYLSQIDELQQRMQLQAFGFAAGATAIVTLTLGLLENAGLPRISMVWVMPMIVAFWGLASGVIAWRNR